jgi:hypothetical protein
LRDCPRLRNRRGTLRTDVGAGRCEWMRGRAVPVFKQVIGLPEVFKWSVGDVLALGVDGVGGTAVACVHYATGLIVLT